MKYKELTINEKINAKSHRNNRQTVLMHWVKHNVWSIAKSAYEKHTDFFSKVYYE